MQWLCVCGGREEAFRALAGTPPPLLEVILVVFRRKSSLLYKNNGHKYAYYALSSLSQQPSRSYGHCLIHSLADISDPRLPYGYAKSFAPKIHS